jgi:hypothetical protein
MTSWLFRPDGTLLPVLATPEPETVARLFRHTVSRCVLADGAIADAIVRNLLA